MYKRTIFLILLLLLTVGVIILALQQKPPTEKETTTTSKQQPTPPSGGAPRNFTTLVASPSANIVSEGRESSFSIVIDTGGNNVAAAQLEMLFNPEYIRVVRIEPQDFFNNPTVLLNEIDNKVGSISFALGTVEARAGRGNLVAIIIVAKKATQGSSTPITFLPKTTVGEIGNLSSVLKEAIGANFIIKE